jgi:hypothetical protein
MILSVRSQGDDAGSIPKIAEHETSQLEAASASRSHGSRYGSPDQRKLPRKLPRGKVTDLLERCDGRRLRRRGEKDASGQNIYIENSRCIAGVMALASGHA